MYIPIGFIILFLFAPDLAIICGIIALAFMFPQISIPIAIFLFILYCINNIPDKPKEQANTTTEKEIKEDINKQTKNEIPDLFKKIFFWNIDPKKPKWYQVCILVPYWILLIIILIPILGLLHLIIPF